MTTPSPTPKDPQSTAAAVLFAMPQTPPKAGAIRSNSLKTSQVLESRSAASSPMPDSNTVSKVSNSDDEDMAMQVRISRQRFNTSESRAPRPSSGESYAAAQVLRDPVRPIMAGDTPGAVSFVPTLTATNRLDGAPLYEFPYGMAENEHTIPFPLVGGFSGLDTPRDVHHPAQRDAGPIPRSQWPSMVPPDMLSYYLGPASFTAQDRADVASRHASVPLQYMSRLPHESGFMSLSFGKAMSGSRRVSHPPPEAESMVTIANADAGRSQYASQPPLQAGTVYPPSRLANKEHQRPVPNAGNVSDSGLSEDVEVRRYVQIPRASYKHTATPPRTGATKRSKNGFATEQIRIEDFYYRTIKSIKMPARGDLMPGEDIPEPTPENLPYGDDVDYRASMLIYWLDEQELTYSETARRYRLKFPSETANDDTIRKRHIGTLVRLARRYGLKAEDEVEEPGKAVLRRGQQAGYKYSTIGGRVVYAGPQDDGKSSAGVRPKKITQPLASRGFLMACICVWKDTSDVSFEQIQRRLADEYGWKMTANTVQKLYYQERPRVYDTYGDAGNNVGKEPDDTEDTT